MQGVRQNTKDSNKNKESMLKTVAFQQLLPPTAVYSSQNGSYTELQLFKAQVQSERYGPQFKPYSASKRNVFMYRMIFLGIGVFYLILGLILFNQSMVWSVDILFGSSYSIKALLCSFCALLGTSSISLGFTLKAERDAARRFYHQTKQRVKQIYARKRNLSGIWGFIPMGEDYRRSRAFAHLYREALEKLHACRDNVLCLLECISRAPTLDAQAREELYNQAILEFKDRADIVVKNFETSQPQSITWQVAN